MKLLLSLALLFLLTMGCVNMGNSGSNEKVPLTTSTPSPSAMASASASGGVKIGDSVSVDYVGSTTDGKVFDTSVEAEAKKANLPLRPSYSTLSFTVGAGQMIKGFDSGVVGMKVGEVKTVTLPPAEAYGEMRTDLITSVPLTQLSNSGINATVGTKLGAGNGLVGTITAVNSTHATIDFNHELAGKTLIFKITMRKIN